MTNKTYQSVGAKVVAEQNRTGEAEIMDSGYQTAMLLMDELRAARLRLQTLRDYRPTEQQDPGHWDRDLFDAKLAQYALAVKALGEAYRAFNSVRCHG